MPLTYLAREIQGRKESNNFRVLSPTSNQIDFSSNDYLGLATNPELKAIIQHQFNTFNLDTGSTGSRLLSGNSLLTENLEQKLAEFFKADAALVFNSGYTANLAVLSTIPQKGDTILYDELAHACIKDGARLSLAKRYKFKHNDLEDLEKKINIATGQIFIVVESLYSMDGDYCPLTELVSLAKKYGAEIILDEAHSTGWIGEPGSGLATALHVENEIAIRIHTFGKAMGVHGACVCGSTILIEYLINFARPFIYTTALPPHNILSIACAIDFITGVPELAQKLHNNIFCFLQETENFQGVSKNRSCIQSVIVPGNQAVQQAAMQLQKNGFDVRPIRTPTVPIGKERLRICLHAFNTEKEISGLIETIRLVV